MSLRSENPLFFVKNHVETPTSPPHLFPGSPFFSKGTSPGPTDTTTSTYYDDNEPIDDAACESSVALGNLEDETKIWERLAQLTIQDGAQDSVQWLNSMVYECLR